MKTTISHMTHDTLGFWEAPIVLIQNVHKELSFSAYRIPEMQTFLRKDEISASALTSEKMVTLVELGIFHLVEIGEVRISHGNIDVTEIDQEYQELVRNCFFAKDSKPHSTVERHVAVCA